jgi:hypothetical protein
MKRKHAYATIFALLASLGQGCQNYLAFNTDTKFGLDISQSAQAQPEVTFGYQRLAVVSMPAGTNANGGARDANTNSDGYSVVGSISIKYNPSLIGTNGGVRILQLFATGQTAREVSSNEALAGLFAKDLASIYIKTKKDQTNAPKN